MSSVTVRGRSGCARLLRLLADQIDQGELIHPPSMQPAPHLGPFVVRIGGIDYDLAAGLPGVIDEDDDEPTEPA